MHTGLPAESVSANALKPRRLPMSGRLRTLHDQQTSHGVSSAEITVDNGAVRRVARPSTAPPTPNSNPTA